MAIPDQEESDREGVGPLPLTFLGFDETPILYANHFIAQSEGRDFILTVGQVAPPLLLGSREERWEQARLLSSVSVKVVARVAMNRERVAQLIDLLEHQLRRDDERQAQGG